MHAAGVVITDKPVMEYVPLAVNSGVTVTQFPMNTIADIGLLKMDFLGLRYLTVIRDAVELIRYKNPGFSIENIPYDDAETFDMISAGRNAGVFQLESGGMTSLCVQMKPRNIEDITAAIALYRPGPMDSIPKYLENRKNADAIKYDVPAFKNILGVTYGCIVYQEQVMQIFRELAGYSYGRADLVRRAMSKKKQKEMEKEREYFLHGKTVLSPDGSGVIEECYGALKYGLDEDTANKIFNEMAEFAKYAFNKSHAAAYSIITYRTAYLKCRFPSEYLAARLSAALIDGKVPFYMAECAKSGIPVLPPDINESNMGFSAITREGKPAIRFGLLAVKNVGEGFIHDMFIERASRPFSDFADFIMRMSVAGLNRKTVESLVLAGAFDSFGIERNRLVAVTENAINSVARSKKQNISGQLDLFADRSGYESAENNGGGSLDIEYPALPPLSEKEKLALEREVCGMYLSGHPMYEYADIPGVTQISYLSEENSGIPAFSDGDAVTLCGMITSKKIKPAKNNSRVAFVELEDLSGKTELILFESVLAKCEKLLYDESIVTVAGTVSTKGDEIKILARSVVAAKKPGPRNNTDIGSAGTAKASDISSADKYAEKPENVNFQASDKIYLRLPSKGTKIEKRIMALLDIFEGSTPVIVYYGDEKKSYRLSGLGCAPDDKLIAELRHLAGEDNVVYKQS
ncbi:DNA polymerase III subunit alpha [bioreactor metagenome]|uniref:DNA-directed DNA polymerase n=1 Tax=bioreactor metagenome TaxID=1076179 RepID=A0A645AJB0_9ZZZZ